MQLRQFYPVIQTDQVTATAVFYKRHFGFSALFETDWYVHLQQQDDEGVNLAILAHDHDSIPAEGRGKSKGMILNFEVDDIDAQDARLRAEGVGVIQALRDEPFGQRHAIYRDPNGILIDVIKPIPPAEGFDEGYVEGALPS